MSGSTSKPSRSRSSAKKSSSPPRKSSKPSQRPANNRPMQLVSALVFLGVALAIFLSSQGCLDPAILGLELENEPTTAVVVIPTPDPAVAPTPVADSIEVYFSTPHLIYPDRPAERSPHPHELALLADLYAAQSTILVAVFEYDLPSIAEALIDAHERGVIVRVALDRGNLEDERDAAWAGMLMDAGIPINWEESSSFLHSKIFMIDDAIVWLGSGNATINDYYRNNNNWLRITNPLIIQNVRGELNEMLSNRFGRRKTKRPVYPVLEQDGRRIETYFAPTDRIYPEIITRIQGAQESVKFMAFSYTNPEIAAAMIERADAGMRVSGVYEKRNASGLGSEFQTLADAGVDVWVDGNCYTMHHKVIIIDDRTVITGSYNFTGRAENENDEVLLIIDDRELAQLYEEEFQRVYTQALLAPACGGR